MIRDVLPHEFPELLSEIPDCPERLRLEGELPREGHKLLAVVGARKYSNYGREVCQALIAGLAGEPITIVSGLALGIDSIAHRAALESGLQTIAIPGSGLDRSVIHPRSHASLADEIVENGGGLISEYDDTMPSGVWAFPRRNRIMAGMCHATVVIEAERKSGTLITSRLATEYNREVGAVPGPITSPTSDGPHLLLKLGAAIIRDSNDILELLGLKTKQLELINVDDLTSEEEIFVKALSEPRDRDELIRVSKLDISQANAVLSLMEIKGYIREELGLVHKTF
jgi:DNA processing protein